MAQYLVSIYLPDEYVPPADFEAMSHDIDALNDEMIAAGLKVAFRGGLAPAGTAKTLRPQPDGTVLITDGPYLETKEHMGGFSVMEASNLDEALEWARKGSLACRASGEVRPFGIPPAKAGA
jgi:hypothetical protein